jgi:hypothetical protein
LPVERFAVDKEKVSNTPLFERTQVYGRTILVENDSGNETSKPFTSMDKFSQVHKGKGESKEECKIESLEKWHVNLSDEVLKISVHPPE